MKSKTFIKQNFALAHTYPTRSSEPGPEQAHGTRHADARRTDERNHEVLTDFRVL